MTKKAATQAHARTGRAEACQSDGHAHFEGLDDLIGYHIHLAYRIQVQRFASIGAEYNIRASQFAILKLVYCNSYLKQTDLARALYKKHANVVTALDELQGRGLISRVPDRNDRRSRVIRLTRSGEKLARDLMDRYVELNRDLREKLGKRELEQLIELLHKFSRIGTVAEPKN